ncbi:BTB/POZ domain-containing protein 1 domain protein [Acanthocheilonema viteae]
MSSSEFNSDGTKRTVDRTTTSTNRGTCLQDSRNEPTSSGSDTSCHQPSNHICVLHTGNMHQNNNETTSTNSARPTEELIVDPIHIPPLGNMNQNNVHFEDDLSESYVEGASLEIENGYPLVADLEQLHLENGCMSINDIIQPRSFNSDSMDDIAGMQRDSLDDSNTRASELLERKDETLGVVTAGEATGPLHDVATIVHKASSFRVSVNRRLVDAQGNYFDRREAGEVPCMGWQASKSTLKERFAFLYCNEILADVWFVVGRGELTQRIPAHKFILISGSAVFDAMFNGGLSNYAIASETSSAEGSQDIDLPDVEPGAFLALLKFLYTDDVSFGPEIVMTTLYTAKKYAVPAMELACVDFLKRNLGADNAFMLLTQARLFDEPQLANLCLDIIDRNTIEALNAEGFTEIDLDTLCVVLKRNTLRVPEAPLFLAVLRWSAEECRRRSLTINAENQRTVLGRALHMIRFPLMTIDEFAHHAAQTGILTDRELVSLFLYYTVNPKPQIEFVDVPRCCVFGKEVVVSRFQRVEGRWGYSGTPDRIKFTVDRRIYVIGFGLHGSIHGPSEYQVTIQILHCGTGKILASNDTSFSCDGSCGTFRVLFKDPVEINPCVTYIASARLKGPDSFYGTKGLRRIVHQSPSTGVITFQFTYAAGNNNGTSVEDGQIPEIIFCTKII